jgi:hypothetical protein
LRHQRWLFVRTERGRWLVLLGRTTGKGPARPRRRSKFYSETRNLIFSLHENLET